MSDFDVLDLGRVGYTACRDLQADLLEQVANGTKPDTLILVEHDPVLTLGANFHESNLLLPIQTYQDQGIEVLKSERGGDVTYHGPGQLVVYPIFDIAKRGRDLHKWLRSLEESVLHVLAGYGLEARRFPPHTGVWIGNKKVAAAGIHVRRWVSMHGIAVNCDLDLAPFDLIVPCGIMGYGVTSISEALGRRVDIEQVKPRIIEAFRTVPIDPKSSQL